MANKRKKVDDEFYSGIEEFSDELGLNREGMVEWPDPIWEKMAKKFNISKKAFYLRIKTFKKKNRLLKVNADHDSDGECVMDKTRSDDEENNELTIVLDPKELEKILPHERIYKDDNKTRVEKTLKPGWTDVICDVLWRKIKLSCCLSFKKVDVTSNGFKTNGICKECNFVCIVHSSEDFTSLYVQITPGLKNYPHKIKRKVTGTRRAEIATSMNSRTATVVRNEMANNLMEDGDDEPATIPNTGNSHTTENSLAYLFIYIYFNL